MTPLAQAQTVAVPALATASGTAATRTEGALGLVLRQQPRYLGAASSVWRVTPAGFLRWRWLSITGDGGFTTRSREPVEGGLAAVLAAGERSRLRLGLSWDGGRSTSASPELAGLEDVPATARVRLGFGVTMPQGWGVDASLAVDALGRGAGALGQAAIRRGWALSRRGSLSAGLSAAWGDDDHARRRFGVSAAGSAASGLPAFDARAGWQSVQAVLIWRTEFEALGQPWSAFASVTGTMLAGDAARSPVSRRDAWGALSAGLVWRF